MSHLDSLAISMNHERDMMRNNAPRMSQDESGCNDGDGDSALTPTRPEAPGGASGALPTSRFRRLCVRPAYMAERWPGKYVKVAPLAAVGAMLGVSVWRVRRLIRLGLLDGIRGFQGKRCRWVPMESLERFISRYPLALWQRCLAEKGIAIAEASGVAWGGDARRAIRVQ